MKNIMFDTNIFNRIIEGNIDITKINKNEYKLFITHIQRNELEKTGDQDKKDKLMKLFSSLNQESIPTESAVWGISEWGGGKYTSENNLYEPIRKALDDINKKDNNIQDALISETCIRNNYTLITEDQDLVTVTKKFNGSVMSLQNLLDHNEK